MIYETYRNLLINTYIIVGTYYYYTYKRDKVRKSQRSDTDETPQNKIMYLYNSVYLTT